MTDNAKPKISKKPVDHPKYSDMIKAAILTLKDRSGSSRQAIVKYITANYKVGETAGRHVKVALKKGTDDGTFIHTKGVGASGSFKLAKEQNKPSTKPTASKKKANAEKKAVVKKPAVKKQTSSAKKSAATKTTSLKKSAPKKSATKTTSPRKNANKMPAAKKAPAAKSAAKAKKSVTKKDVKKPTTTKKTRVSKK